MDTFRTKIEFRFQPNQADSEDLAQECTAYLKTKQFMANRIYQQQEEIEMLKQNVMFHSGKNIRIHEMLNDITDQLEIIRQNVNNIKIKEAESKMNLNNFEDSNEYIVTNEINTSFVCDDNFENSTCGNNNLNNNYDYSKKHKKDNEKKDLNKQS